MASPAAWVALVVLLATRAGAGRDVEVDFPSMPVPNEPFATLEHVNVNSGARWSPRVDEFYFDVLRCARDSRVGVVLLKTNEARAKLRNPMPPIANLSWANVGLQQFHLPFGDGMERELGRQKHSQTVRGEMILAWPRAAMAGLRARLEAWGADVGDDFRFAGPHGNRFVVEAVDDAEARKLIGPVDARRGGPDTMFMGTSEGVGIRGVRFDVPEGSARKICKFYDVVFEARTEVLRMTTCVVKVGVEQVLEFKEQPGDVPPYDGHHVALYVNGDAFVRIYDQLFVRGLTYTNPRFPHLKSDSIVDAVENNEFRIKDIVDLDTFEGYGHPAVFELEHEVRSLLHPGFALKGRLPRKAREEL